MGNAPRNIKVSTDDIQELLDSVTLDNKELQFENQELTNENDKLHSDISDLEKEISDKDEIIRRLRDCLDSIETELFNTRDVRQWMNTTH